MTTTAPRWDLTPLYPSLDDRSFNNAVEGVYAEVDRLAALYDEFDIRETESRAVTDADVAGMEAVLTLTNVLSEELQRVRAYLYALTTTDSRDDAAAAQMAEMQTRTAALGPLGKRLGAWLASLNVDDFVNRSELAAQHEFALRKGAENAELQMGEHEESLAAELAGSGSLAWQRLHGDVSSQLMVDVGGQADSDGDGARAGDASRRGNEASGLRR